MDVYTDYLKNALHFNGNVGKSTLYDVPKPVTVKYKMKMKIKTKIKYK